MKCDIARIGVVGLGHTVSLIRAHSDLGQNATRSKLPRIFIRVETSMGDKEILKDCVSLMYLFFNPPTKVKATTLLTTISHNYYCHYA